VEERFAANGLPVQRKRFLFDWRQISLAVPELIARRAALLPVAAALAPAVEAEYRYEGEQEEAELNLAADPALRGIYESDLRRIPVVPVELVEVFAASVRSMFRSDRSCLICLPLSTAAETKLRQQLAVKKVSYLDSRVSRFNDRTM